MPFHVASRLRLTLQSLELVQRHVKDKHPCPVLPRSSLWFERHRTLHPVATPFGLVGPSFPLKALRGVAVHPVSDAKITAKHLIARGKILLDCRLRHLGRHAWP